MNRIEKIQKGLAEKGLDAIVLFSEPNVRYAGQFAFTDGAVVVTRQRAVLLTDSRYIEAAAAEAKDVETRLFDAAHPFYDELKAALDGCEAIGAEENRLAHAKWETLGQKLGHDLRPAEAIMDALRAVKDAERALRPTGQNKEQTADCRGNVRQGRKPH